MVYRSFPRTQTLSVAICCLSLPAIISAQNPNQTQSPARQEKPAQTKATERQRAAEELKQEERQRILGVVPNFNTTNDLHAAPLSASQKYSLALRSAIDPFQFVAAGLDAGYSQATGAFSGYGQGALGYGKRFGAAYADSFDGTMIGNGFLPAIMRDDPRYFRKGSGTLSGRIWWAVLSIVRCKSDDGRWTPNYPNILGNVAAGGISNAYYPAADRGAALTFERAFTVTAEGALGALADEFWPDIQRKLHRKQW